MLLEEERKRETSLIDWSKTFFVLFNLIFFSLPIRLIVVHSSLFSLLDLPTRQSGLTSIPLHLNTFYIYWFYYYYFIIISFIILYDKSNNLMPLDWRRGVTKFVMRYSKVREWIFFFFSTWSISLGIT